MMIAGAAVARETADSLTKQSSCRPASLNAFSTNAFDRVLLHLAVRK